MKTILYHGSENVVTPQFGGGKRYNDYGLGFYCTENIEMAKEWACAKGGDGYANVYEISTDGLSILDLNDGEHNILNWLAILLDNRRFVPNGPLATSARNYILENFLPDYKDHDIIKGYRADDSYFSFAGDFISNSLSLPDLKAAMTLGSLGEQFVLKSRESFKRIKIMKPIPVRSDEYAAKYSNRDLEARKKYQKIAAHPFSPDNLYVLDIIRNNIHDGDPRL